MPLSILRYPLSVADSAGARSVEQVSDAATAVAELFYAAVHSIDSAVYSKAQQHAWAPYPIDYAKWQQRLALKKPWLAFADSQLCGFIELDADGHIDCLYVHPQHQGCGVARALYQQLEQQAKLQGISRLTVEASKLAQPFFRQQGFNTLWQNLVQRGEQQLVNFSMEKYLA